MKKFTPLAVLFALALALVMISAPTASASDVAHRYGRGHYPAAVHRYRPIHHHGHHVRPLPPVYHHYRPHYRHHHRPVVMPCPGGLHIVTPYTSVGIHF